MKLTIQNVTKKYSTRDKKRNEIHALNDVSFSIGDGEFCAVVGESGSGKSTLSQIITGIIPATRGTVYINDIEINPVQRRKNKEISKKIQLVLQDGKSALDPHFNIYECIAEPIRNLCKMSREQEKKRVYELLEQMELSRELLKRKPHELSGGQQKRVCIARALATNPDILILDEAISGLDVLLRKNILDTLKRIYQESDCTMLFITHDMDVALYMANRIIVMKDGVVVEDTHCNGNSDCLTHPYSKLLAAAMMPENDKSVKTA
ncbi:MAG: ABC transporter ATP-binding protein [Lachnospiraceae bacterium]|nr:ABC transporter ATP-binding protein [Lachnospiraceae bacterium]